MPEKSSEHSQSIKVTDRERYARIPPGGQLLDLLGALGLSGV